MRFELRALHLTSLENRGADLLSRWHMHPRFQSEFYSSYRALDLQEVTVPEALFHLYGSV